MEAYVSKMLLNNFLKTIQMHKAPKQNTSFIIKKQKFSGLRLSKLFNKYITAAKFYHTSTFLLALFKIMYLLIWDKLFPGGGRMYTFKIKLFKKTRYRLASSTRWTP